MFPHAEFNFKQRNSRLGRCRMPLGLTCPSLPGVDSQSLAEGGLHQLAVGVARQGTIEKNEAVRDLVVGETRGAEAAQALPVFDTVARMDDRKNLLPQHRIGERQDSGFGDGGVGGQNVLDFGAEDLVAA